MALRRGKTLLRFIQQIVDRLIGYRSGRTFTTSSPRTIRLRHDSGFFSNCSVLLQGLARAGHHPLKVDATASFSHYASDTRKFRWEDCFEQAKEPLIGNPQEWALSRVASRLPHHSLYRFIDFKTSTEIIENYFCLSPMVLSRAATIQRDLPVPPEKLVALCLRGTDKGSEVRQSRLSRYVRKARRVARLNPGVRIWIQTDQSQLRDDLLEKIGPSAFALDVLPTTEGSNVIHKLKAPTDKHQLAIDLVSITWLMSRAAQVITYTGNVGYWIALFRGNAHGLHQLR